MFDPFFTTEKMFDPFFEDAPAHGGVEGGVVLVGRCLFDAEG
jgi:hypothetical protein